MLDDTDPLAASMTGHSTLLWHRSAVLPNRVGRCVPRALHVGGLLPMGYATQMPGRGREARCVVDLLVSTSVERFVAAAPAQIRCAIAEMTAAAWGSASRLVADDACLRVDALFDVTTGGHADVTTGGHADVTADATADGDAEREAAVWLSWQLTPLERRTHVRLVLDEFERGPDATQELSALLEELALRVAPVEA